MHILSQRLAAAVTAFGKEALRSGPASVPRAWSAQASPPRCIGFCAVPKQHVRHQHATPCAAAARPAESLSDDADFTYGVNEDIGFIGAGQMGEAMIRGFLESGVSHPSRLSASVRSTSRAREIAELGVSRVFRDAVTAGGAEALARSASVIILGVKPQGLPDVLRALAPHVGPDHLVISIAAGVRISTIERALGADVRVARVMPNTPMLVGQGASAYALGAVATENDEDIVRALLSGVGLAVRVDEGQIDAVTGVSGSGPAYAYMMIEAMADGGVAAGLPRAKALALAAKTVAGAAAMVLNEQADGELDLVHPGVLKDRVASPAGTTIAAISSLERSGLRSALIEAVQAAAQRSAELGKGDEK